MATTEELLRRMTSLGLRLPIVGTGRNGKILNRDLEKVISDHYAKKIESPGFHLRYNLGAPQLAARYDSLNEKEKELLFEDNNDWVMEEKYDGCRILICYVPEEGFTAWGRNASVETLLPLNYTSKLICRGEPLYSLKHKFNTPFVLDCEAITNGYVEMEDGRFSSSTLNAVVSMLHMDVEKSIAAQAETPIELVAFDILVQTDTCPRMPFYSRRVLLESIVKSLPFRLCEQYTINKLAVYNQLINEGKEGVVFKHLKAPYRPGLSGYRDKRACVKLKRNLSANNDIDAYIIGYTEGTEWVEKRLIAGVKLGVNLAHEDGAIERDYWIATVSSMPLVYRSKLSDMFGYAGRLSTTDPYGLVLTIDGQDISGRNRRVMHATADWERGFRQDKGPEDCTMRETYLNSQIF